MVVELEQILAAIPHDQLAVQWDTNVEFGMLEGDVPAWFADVEGRHPRAAAPARPARPAGRRARLPLLPRPRRDEAERHVPADLGRDGRDRECARRRPRAPARLDAYAAATARPRRGVRRAARATRGPTRHGALPRRRSRPASGDGETGAGSRWRTRSSPSSGSRPRAAGAGCRRVRAGAARHSCPASAPVADPSASSGARLRMAGRRSRGFPTRTGSTQPVDAFGLHYDTVENHGWYRNLDLTVEQLAATCGDGRRPDRLLGRHRDPARPPAAAHLRPRSRHASIVDSSPKFLRVALDRFRDDERVAFRRLRYLKDESGSSTSTRCSAAASAARRARLDERDPPLRRPRRHARAWARVLKPGGTRSDQLRQRPQPARRRDEWIIDETVYVVHEVAIGLVAHGAALRGLPRRARRPRAHARYLEYRDRVFLAPRPLDFYLDALRAAGFEIAAGERARRSRPTSRVVRVPRAYADAVLGWVGGSAKWTAATHERPRRATASIYCTRR